MDVESLAKQLILQNMTPEQQNAVLESVRSTLQEARSNQKRRVSENVGVVVEALKKIEVDIRAKYDDLGQKITDRVNSVQNGRDGIDGRDGKDGKDGRPGRDGATGFAGVAGRDGRDGIDGQDGVSVIDAKIDFDGSLTITLSNGREINVGEVVAPDLAERIKVITNGGGTSQTVIDTLASLQQQIDNLIPSQTGNSGKFLTTNGTTLSWADISALQYEGTWNASTNTPALASSVGTPGDYYIVSVAGTTNLNGITDWQLGDWVIFNGAAWQKIDQSWATAGANDNITSMTGITGGISSPDFIQFDTAATNTNAVGKLYWNNTQNTLAVGLTSAISADIGQTLYARATNAESTTISKGQPVYMFSATGNRVSVKLANNTGDATSAKTFGLAAEDITAGSTGMIICQGVLDGLNLGAYTAGDTVYLGATAGTITVTKPYAPNHLVYIGVIERANNGNGQIYVRVQNGYEMDELHNVSAQNPTNGQVLIYNETTSLWEKNTLTDGTAISITESPGSITIANTGVTALAAGTAISVSGSTGSVTVTNTGVTSIAGTTNEIDVSASTGSVTLSLPSTISANITGNAANVTGTVAIGNGGTGQTTKAAAYNALSPMTTLGDIEYYDGTNGVRLAGNTTTTRKFLRQTGTGTISDAPIWDTLTSSDVGLNNVTNNAQVTSVTGTSPISSSGGTTPAISLSSGYGDTQNPYASKTANTFLAAPNGSAGAPTFRTIVAADVPTLNQNTTGTASNVTGTVAIANGGTGQTSQTAAFDALSPLTTKGDLVLHNGTNDVRLAVGANDFVLTADSTQPTGVKWAAGSGSGSSNYILNSYVSPATWTKPAGLKSIKVTVVGAGGNGGAGTPGQSASGGGGGGTSIRYLSAPAIPGPVSVTAGGGTNSFGAFASATAGANGSTNVNTVGGLGGVGSSGTLNIGGQPGQLAPGNGGLAGMGGASTLGGGGRGTNSVSSTVATGGSGYGGGGGGGASTSTTPGSGAAGVVIIEEFY